MSRVYFLIIGWLCTVVGIAQTPIDTLSLKLQSTMPIAKHTTVIAKDMYDNTYIKKEETLSKIGKHSTSNYHNSKYGELSQVDVANPLAPVLLYEENQIAVVLNKDLLPGLVLNFKDKFPNQQAMFVGANGQNRMWIVDKNNQGAVYIYNTKTLERKTIFRFSQQQNVTSMKFYSSSMYLFFIDDQHKLWAIDSNGNIVVDFLLPQTYDEVFIINSDKLIYSIKDDLYYVDLKVDKVYYLRVEDKSVLSFFYTTGKLSIFTPEKLNNYLLKLP